MPEDLIRFAQEMMDLSGHAELLACACRTAAEISEQQTFITHSLPRRSWENATVFCSSTGFAAVPAAARSALFAVYRQLSLTPGPLQLKRDVGTESIFGALLPEGVATLDAIPLRSRGGQLTGAIVTGGQAASQASTAQLQKLQSIAALTGPAMAAAWRHTQARRDQERLQLLSETTGESLWDWNISLNEVWWGGNLKQLFGEDAPVSRRSDWRRTRIHHDDADRVIASFEAAHASNVSSWSDEYRLRTPDGAIVDVREHVYFLREVDGIAYRAIGTVRDISPLQQLLTREKRARGDAESANQRLQELNATLESRVQQAVEDQRQAQEALRQSQKMEAMGQLTGGVAHDFNNLLTLILGGLDTIHRNLDRLPSSEVLPRVRRATQMAQHGAKRAATLTARLLAVSRQQSLSPTLVNPNRLLSGITDLLQRTLGATTAIETVTAAGIWGAFIDASELENALINLAVNARDAMPEGGRLTIETANTHLDDAYVAALAEPVAPGQYVLIAVSDTGTGMSAATLARVFEPFFTTKDVGKGTGLGLAQVYGFVRQSNGHVRIYSELGVGTTVNLYFPKAQPSAYLTELPSEHAATTADGGNETILVVEDDEALREYSAGILEELGYKVLLARSGPSALELLQTNADVALLFTDIVLPDGLNGKQLADEALRRRPGLKVLYATGYARNAIVHNGHLPSTIDLITKPFTSEELSTKCRAILDRAANT
ncbi:PAS domain-containing hybrid sensor histidine kinase/response regulator [Steroidobacter sp.]|uniref:PAS domain-containing hybrid sensor histidine kinase/response regulator n=1 Tax=Steroidobacter sp. TaxID=1978227 RepID=UPI001A60952B|nr:PAS domain-containing hybrid sensor histidine kinase/response regulator [Steroidobacter sp.]MBL8270468.1 response regulator [Steroidobacter sp.]